MIMRKIRIAESILPCYIEVTLIGCFLTLTVFMANSAEDSNDTVTE